MLHMLHVMGVRVSPRLVQRQGGLDLYILRSLWIVICVSEGSKDETTLTFLKASIPLRLTNKPLAISTQASLGLKR
jgi:hypothetical protein